MYSFLIRPALGDIKMVKIRLIRIVSPHPYLQINFCLFFSFRASAEIGDFDETQSWQHLLHNKYLPDQDAIRDKITECHRKHA